MLSRYIFGCFCLCLLLNSGLQRLCLVAIFVCILLRLLAVYAFAYMHAINIQTIHRYCNLTRGRITWRECKDPEARYNRRAHAPPPNLAQVFGHLHSKYINHLCMARQHTLGTDDDDDDDRLTAFDPGQPG